MLRAKDDKELDGLLNKYEDFQKDNKINDVNKVRNDKIEENKKKLDM